MEIAQANLVEEAFGEWPSFHDAEVISIALRRGKEAGTVSSLLASVQVQKYAPTNIGTAQFEMALIHDFIISFEFQEVSEVNLSGFNRQNVIDSLTFTPEGSSCKVHFESIYGVECSFLCNSIAVTGVAKGSGT
jgi:hypothetical protein